jgi:hypothetical protein
MKKNRRGNLLPEETLKIVIAVICIIFLVILVTSIYFALTGSEEAKYAEASKGLISKEITRINNGGETNPSGLLVPNPAGWYVLSFLGNNKKPNLCTGESCICLCRNILINVFDRQIKECDSRGVCSVVPNLKSFDKIKIENSGTFISIQKINNEIQIAKK